MIEHRLPVPVKYPGMNCCVWGSRKQKCWWRGRGGGGRSSDEDEDEEEEEEEEEAKLKSSLISLNYHRSRRVDRSPWVPGTRYSCPIRPISGPLLSSLDALWYLVQYCWASFVYCRTQISKSINTPTTQICLIQRPGNRQSRGAPRVVSPPPRLV